MKNNYLKLFLLLFLIASFCFLEKAEGSTGTINPTDNVQKYFKALIQADDSVINMGWYEGGATVSAGIPVTITDTELTGFAFAENYGWINLNCSNTTTAYPSGICGTSNFKVTNTDGTLSGYAWGENIGWINFGPSESGQTYPQVEINTSVAGEFVGYAWSENLGWILFDCTVGDDSCTRTDWDSACNDGIDNDDDGDIDFGVDTQCSSTSDNSEGIFQCSDGADNDGDGFIDFPDDPQCSSGSDNKEAAGLSSSTSGQSSGVSADTSSPEDAGEGDSPVENNTENQNNTSEGSGGSGSNGGLFPTENPPESLDIPEEAFDQFNENNNFFDSGFSVIKNIADSILSTETRVNIASTISGAGAALAVSGSIPTLISLVSVSEVALIPVRIGSLFLSALGIRRKKWGIVYDAVTKQPLDPVYVVLQDMMGSQIATSITDLDGRYGFLVKKGNYKITAGKTNYEFPAKNLIGKNTDGIYDDLYYGQEINIPEDGAVLAYNIPMTPIGFDWNEEAKRKQHIMKFYSKRKKITRFFSGVMFYFGLILSIFVAVVQPRPYTFVILAFYAFVFILHRLGIKERAHGVVIDKETGYGIPFSIVRVYSQQTGIQIKNCVSDATGKYLCLLGNGVYKIVVEKKLPDGSYQKIHERENVTVKKGIISDTFEL